jgi:hypothetical protein
MIFAAGLKVRKQVEGGDGKLFPDKKDDDADGERVVGEVGKALWAGDESDREGQARKGSGLGDVVKEADGVADDVGDGGVQLD